jgi:hypothetical protein
MENNTIKLIIKQYSDQNYWGEDQDQDQGEWDQFIDLETNNYTSNEDIIYEDIIYEDLSYKNITSSNSKSSDYYGNSNFNIISFTIIILNLFEQLINYANRI